ncbi:hypothetical protein QR680_009757 [Steinernema hermaphroditum]|uniref:Derlin n=1 Tax=Steinernema hermaphroditum TaxID=289476 RepID=A0AA39ILJ9_9BILA|nr:hypothetical protein QR680_009757 [Steinernema hermaphroditum]
MSDFGDWYRSVPEITRYWLTGSVVASLLGRIGMFSPYTMHLDWQLFATKFHIWRPLTALFYYPVNPSSGFHWLFMLYLLYSYGKSTEKDVFTGRPADYLFMLIFNWISCTIVSFAVGIPFLLEPMVVSVLYVWCQLNKDMIVSFLFGAQFKAVYLPWVLVLFNMILRGTMVELAGVVVGHIYYFLMYSYPQEFGGASLIKTPQFLYQWFPSSVGGVHGFGSAPESRRPAPRNDGGHNWGRGQQLGSS